MYDNRSETFIYTKAEGSTNTYNGRMDNEVDGIGVDGEIDSFNKEKTLNNFVSTGKPFLDLI